MSGNVVDPNFTRAMDNAAREAANMQSQSGDGQKVKDVYIYKVELRISLLDTTVTSCFDILDSSKI